MSLVQADKVALVLPTLNAGGRFGEWLTALANQGFRPGTLVVIDSTSTDDTPELARRAGFHVHTIARDDFDHGGTRQLGVEIVPMSEVVVFLTQDAMLADPDALRNLLMAFEDDRVGAAYGRQVAGEDASPFERHARLFNYPDECIVKGIDDVPRMGIKTVFISNSFSAYRRKALLSVGGFPSDIIFGEDTFVAAKMIISGWKVAYCADARVFHSHNGSAGEELRRYFDIGVLHTREPWIMGNFGKAGGEGMRYVRSTLSYLAKSAPHHIPSAAVRIACRLTGFKLGSIESRLPVGVKRRLSMNRKYWEKEET